MLSRSDILSWLRQADDRELERLWAMADSERRDNVGDEVHLRGLIEFSNHCSRQCHYCGLRAGNQALVRYRMTTDEILGCVAEAVRFEYGTVVLQSGEDPALDANWLRDLIRRIKQTTSLAVTLSLGERTPGELGLWREAGADRYLCRFETSNVGLYRRIHPAGLHQGYPNRLEMLNVLRGLAYEIGSGIMIGIPGQTYDDLANDLQLFAELDLDMIGVGPFIAHSATPLGTNSDFSNPAMREQVPNSEQMTYKVVALARMVCPRSNIPSTTALATLNLSEGRELGLQRGANVIMPNLTPTPYRVHYEIYPNKACIRETSEQCHGCIKRRIASIGRRVARGPGAARSMLARNAG